MAPFHRHRPSPRVGAQDLFREPKVHTREANAMSSLRAEMNGEGVEDFREPEAKPGQQLRKRRSKTGSSAAWAMSGRAVLRDRNGRADSPGPTSPAPPSRRVTQVGCVEAYSLAGDGERQAGTGAVPGGVGGRARSPNTSSRKQRVCSSSFFLFFQHRIIPGIVLTF